MKLISCPDCGLTVIDIDKLESGQTMTCKICGAEVR